MPGRRCITQGHVFQAKRVNVERINLNLDAIVVQASSQLNNIVGVVHKLVLVFSNTCWTQLLLFTHVKILGKQGC